MAPYFIQPAKNLTAKLKFVRQGIRKWSEKIYNLQQLIENCSWVLALLDGLEEQRNLSQLELNFRSLVCKHIAFLLEAKRIFWKQRSTARWVTLGDENTKFFHAFATRNYRRNYIATLKVDENTLVSEHDLKVGILLATFQDRLGCSEFTNISYDDLGSFIQPILLPVLDDPFSDEEILMAVKAMPPDHAPGPDGF
ncbi:uncharacterized protein [Miscanthus floridulus]